MEGLPQPTQMQPDAFMALMQIVFPQAADVLDFMQALHKSHPQVFEEVIRYLNG